MPSCHRLAQMTKSQVLELIDKIMQHMKCSSRVKMEGVLKRYR